MHRYWHWHRIRTLQLTTIAEPILVHCELNWIEYYWGSCKHFAPRHCRCALAGRLRLGVRKWRGTECQFLSLAAEFGRFSQALESIKGSLIYKYWKRTQSMLQAYTEGASLRKHTTGKRGIEATVVCKLTRNWPPGA